MIRTIQHDGFGFTNHIETIENYFNDIPGIRVERININYVDLKIKKAYPLTTLNKHIACLMDILAQERIEKPK